MKNSIAPTPASAWTFSGKPFYPIALGTAWVCPTVPLADLYGGCKLAIERKGGEVMLRAPVRASKSKMALVAGILFDDEKMKRPTPTSLLSRTPH